MKLEVGMYVRTLTLSGFSRIGKLEKIDDICITDNGAVDKKQITKARHKIGELLEGGDFLDYHCIEKIEGTTIYLTDGWFIDFDDVEDLVGTICTKEQFKSISYEVRK